MKSDIGIIGSSISGSFAAAYLKQKFPELNVYVIGKLNESLPIVGESLTEYSTFMLRQIGLGQVLEEDHFHKYGLTFYFKENLQDPRDRTYAVHEAIEIPPLPSKQINRFNFDKQLIEHGRALGVKFIDGLVTEVTKKDNGGFELAITEEGGKELKLDTRWLVDASGRRRVLATKFGLKEKSKYQRSSFWFRLVDFDDRALFKINGVKKPQFAYDSYYVTHHFFGKANWIWCIPMRTSSFRNMISIGVVWRPDLVDEVINSLDKFNEFISKEHDVIGELVSSGRVMDTNFYSKYLHRAKQVYSKEGWFIIGDAANAVDPLYSTGLVMTSLQLTQVGELIRRDLDDRLSEDCVRDLEEAFVSVWEAVQGEISTLYEVMHDPYQSSWRMHIASLQYFYFLLPSLLSGYFVDPGGARWVCDVLKNGQLYYQDLLSLLQMHNGNGHLKAKNLKNHYDRTVNWDLNGPCEREMGKYFSKMLTTFSSIHFELLKNAGWPKPMYHLSQIAKGLIGGAVLPVTFKDPRLERARRFHYPKDPEHKS